MTCKECEEQARLLGMGAERELKLMAEIEALRKLIEAAREALEGVKETEWLSVAKAHAGDGIAILSYAKFASGEVKPFGYAECAKFHPPAHVTPSQEAPREVIEARDKVLPLLPGVAL